jgi:hypothetical protein
MSDFESISSQDGDGDVNMAGICRTHSYKVSFDLYYDHTYEPEDPDPDAVAAATEALEGGADDADSQDGYYEGQAVPCNDPDCTCDGEEAPLTAEEVDEFLRESYCGEKPRYYYYCTSVLEALNFNKTGVEYRVRDVEYADGGKLRCVLDVINKNNKKRPSASKLEHMISELDLYNSIYAGGPGNEAIIPTKHEYRYITMSSFTYEQTEQERGRIDFRGHYKVTPL